MHSDRLAEETNMRNKILQALISLVLGVAIAGAAPIPGLVSTGGASQGSLDPNWLWTPVGSGTFLSPYVTQTDSSGFPFYAWVANDAASKWISPQSGYGNDNEIWGDAPGQYMYRLIFNIPGTADVNTATFTYRIATDNVLHSMWLNGHMIQSAPFGYTSMSGPFTVGPGSGLFLTGQNILDIIVVNTGNNSGIGAVQNSWNPTGLRLEIVSSDIFIPEPPPSGEIPEPGTMLMMAAGLCGLGLLRCFRCAKRG
jgi:hypothetical protein